MVFSRSCLDRMALQYQGYNFDAALKEMAVAAAMQAEPVHLRETLLLRHNKPALNPMERELLTDRLQEYLAERFEGFLAFPRENTVGLDLIQAERKPGSLTAVLLLDESKGEAPTRLPALGGKIEVVTVSGTMPYWEKCLEGARKATAETLCFIVPEYTHCTADGLLGLLSYRQLPEAGILSPRIVKGAEDVYVGCSLPMAKQLTIHRTPQLTALLKEDLRALRQTALPAWQCWMVRKDLFLELMDTVLAAPDMKNCSRDYFLLECALRAEALGRKNYYIGSVAFRGEHAPGDEACEGFYSMLFRNRAAFMQDRFCPAKFGGYRRQNGLRKTVAWFPEQMQEYNPSARKILVMTHELSLTGAPVVLSHGVHILREAGVQVVVVSPSDGPLRDKFLAENVPVIIRSDMDDNENWLNWARAFDLILVNTVVPFRQIQQLGKIPTPVMWWLHDARSGYEDYLQYVLPDTVPDNVSIYSVSKYADDAMKTYRPKYKSGLLFYGLQDKGMEQPSDVKKIEGADGKKVFISVGTVIHRKGQDILAEAVRMLPETIRKQCLFLFIGKAIDHDIFQQVLDLQRDFPEEVRQIDAVPHDEIFGLYRQAAAVICSSRDDPLPTFMSETMMVSGICICSENTGTAGVIRQGENGFLYEKDSPRELAQCIRLVVENDDLNRIKVESRKTFEQYFTMEIFKKNLMKCVEESMSRGAEGECK